MTNQEILYGEILTNNLMTKEDLEKYIEENYSLPLYLTYAEWKKRGYQVQKGQKASIKTKLWIRTKKKINKTKENINDNIEENFYLANASLFSATQVQKI